MKSKKINKNKSFVKRMLGDFSSALFELLKKKKLESITVAELCEKVNYPRSTFYNYFEDIYALMDYCWESISETVKINDFKSIDHEKRTLTLFDMVYDFMEDNRASISSLLRNNKPYGAMILSLEKHMKSTIYKMVIECQFSYKYPLPLEIVAEHYSNTVQMVLMRCLLDASITKKDALSYIDFLLGTLEKESTRK